MRRIIRSGAQRIAILRSHECGSDDIPMQIGYRFLTLDFLRVFAHEPLYMKTIRNVLAEHLSVMDILRLTDEEVLQQFTWQITEGYIRLVRWIESPLRATGRSASSEDYSESDSVAGQDTHSEVSSEASSGTDSGIGAGVAETAEESTIDTETTVPQEETDWIEFRVVDDGTGQPVSGVRLKIRLPTGEIRDYTTDGDGIVRIGDLPDGMCDIVEIKDLDAAEVVQVE